MGANDKEKEYKYEDAEDYNSQSKDISFENIVLNHLKRIIWYKSEMRFENFTESVLTLADLLHSRYDDEMKRAEADLIKEEEKCFNNSNITPHYTNNEGNTIYMNTYFDINKQLNNSKKVDGFKINNCKKLFRALCDFLYRKNYLKWGSIED